MWLALPEKDNITRSMAWCSKCERPPCPCRRTLQKVSSGEARPTKARFMSIAEGSLEESRYYLILAHDLGYGGPQEGRMNLLEEVSLLNAYAKALLASGF